MNKQNTNGYPKLLVIFLVAVILIFAVGLVADGWQQTVPNFPVDNNSDKIDNNNNDNVDENTNTEPTEPDIPSEPEIYIPQYVNPLTGLETTDILSLKRHGAFIFNSNSPLYGISAADMLVEVPVENGETRFLAFINEYENLGKIGAISPSRDYITNISGYFSAFPVFCGSDGASYSSVSRYNGLDLSIFQGYHYTEFNSLSYSNGNLLNAGISASNITTLRDNKTLPYLFVPFGENDTSGSKVAISLNLPYSDVYSTELRFSSATSKYTLIKNGTAKHDMLTNNVLSFDNCLILFANTITYETKDGCSLTMETSGSGVGYYATRGTVMNISWTATESGDLKIVNESGDILTVNRGNTYIGYLKASLYDKTIIS